MSYAPLSDEDVLEEITGTHLCEVMLIDFDDANYENWCEIIERDGQLIADFNSGFLKITFSNPSCLLIEIHWHYNPSTYEMHEFDRDAPLVHERLCSFLTHMSPFLSLREVDKQERLK